MESSDDDIEVILSKPLILSKPKPSTTTTWTCKCTFTNNTSQAVCGGVCDLVRPRKEVIIIGDDNLPDFPSFTSLAPPSLNNGFFPTSTPTRSPPRKRKQASVDPVSNNNNNNNNNSDFIQVTLAKKWDRKKNVAGWLMSEKLDGIRAYWNGSDLVSRTGKLFFAPKWFVADLPPFITLDGELFFDRGEFNTTQSIVMTQDRSDRWRQITFVVYDSPGSTGGVVDRLARAAPSLVSAKYAKIHDLTPCKSNAEVLTKLAEIEAVGGEGLMLRAPSSAYQEKRTGDSLKVKRSHDDEALVVGHEDGKGRLEGLVGALLCRLKSGRMFKVGTGFTDVQRKHENVPKIGTVITFSYFELTKDQIPRFPVFVRIRTDVSASIFPVE